MDPKPVKLDGAVEITSDNAPQNKGTSKADPYVPGTHGPQPHLRVQVASASRTRGQRWVARAFSGSTGLKAGKW